MNVVYLKNCRKSQNIQLNRSNILILGFTYVQLKKIVFANVYVGCLLVHDSCLVINAHVNLVVLLMRYLGSNCPAEHVLRYHQHLDLVQVETHVYSRQVEDKIHRKSLLVFASASNLKVIVLL